MSGSLHAWYSLSDLESMAEREAALSGELPLEKLTRLESLLHSAVGSVRASLYFQQRRDGWLQATLDYDTTVQLVCQRCLEPFGQSLAHSVELVLADAATLPASVPEGFEPVELMDGRLQPAQLIEDELIVAIPLVLADVAALPASVPEGFEPVELMDGRLQPAQLIEDELIVSIPLVPKHARVADCGSLARNLAAPSDAEGTG